MAVVSAFAGIALVAIASTGGCGEHAPAASRDAGVDPGPPLDAGVDAGRDAGPPEWMPIEGVEIESEGCIIEQASDPASHFVANWIPCDGRAGCQRLVVESRGVWEYPELAHHDGEHGWFVSTFVETREAEVVRFRALLQDGHPVYVGRTRRLIGVLDGSCTFIPDALGDQSAYWMAATTTSTDRRRHWFAALGPIDSRRTAFDLMPPPGNIMQAHALSDVMLASEVQPVGWVMILDTRTHEPTIFEDIVGTPQNVHAVGDHAVWEEWAGDRIRLAHASLTEDNALFYELEGESADVLAFTTDGVNMAWMQGYDRDCVYGCPDEYDRIEIWTSPYVRRPEDLRPRLVTTHHTRFKDTVTKAGRLAFTGPAPGEVVSSRARTALYVIDLADGRTRMLEEAAGEALAGVLYIADDHVIVRVKARDEFEWWVLRIQIDAIPYR